METSIVTQKSVENEQTAWIKWADYHRLIFGWRTDADAKMIASWIGLFRRSGFTHDEIRAGTDAIARQEKPPFDHAGHLNALEQHARIFRRENLKTLAYSREDQRGTCTDCFNSGLVSVPMLKQVENGQWSGVNTEAVWCKCIDGIPYKNNRDHRDRPLMGITEYFTYNPQWRDQIATRKSLNDERNLVCEEIDLHQKGVIKKNNLDVFIQRLSIMFGISEGTLPARPPTPLKQRGTV